MFTTPKFPRLTVKNFAGDKKGSTAIVMAILTPIIIAGLAFGSEVGYWELTKRRLQNAADTAVYAAATQKRSGLEVSDMKKAALVIANDSGFTLARSDASDPEKAAARGIMTLTSPPDAGDYSGDDTAVRVEMNTTLERRFTKLFLKNDITIASAATARVQNPRPACVLALDPSAASAVDVTGNTSVTLTGCDIAANSISSSALEQSGSGTLAAECISVVGDVDISGSIGDDPDLYDVALMDASECPEPKVNAPITADPYRNRPEPVVPAACATNTELRQLAPNNNQTGNPLPTSFSPTGNNLNKAYCIGNTENVHGVVNMAPGVYVIKCNSPAPATCTFSINATASMIGDGVTLYLTNGVALDINGGATIDLKAPTASDSPLPATSDYYGIVIFFDRDDTRSSLINGGANFSLVGAVYGAKSDVTFTGNAQGSEPGECMQLIAGTVSFSGNSDFDTDCSNSGTTEIRTALSIALVE